MWFINDKGQINAKKDKIKTIPIKYEIYGSSHFFSFVALVMSSKLLMYSMMKEGGYSGTATEEIKIYKGYENNMAEVIII